MKTFQFKEFSEDEKSGLIYAADGTEMTAERWQARIDELCAIGSRNNTPIIDGYDITIEDGEEAWLREQYSDVVDF